MAKRTPISHCFRRFLMSLSLLWACLLYGSAGVAAGARTLAAPSQEQPEGAVASGHTLQQGEQKVSLDATTPPLPFHLTQAKVATPLPTFAAPTDEALPPYAARAPGASLLSIFFPSSVQPHAP